jgi:hypothetical protein
MVSPATSLWIAARAVSVDARVLLLDSPKPHLNHNLLMYDSTRRRAWDAIVALLRALPG